MLESTPKIGRLELLISCMFAGKSSTLISIYNKYKLKYNCLVVNHVFDKRRSGADIVQTHNKFSQSAVCVDRLHVLTSDSHLEGMYALSDVIMIDEAQFFPDLVDFVLRAVEEDGKIVFVFGLSGNYKRERFGQVLDLVPLADKVSHLKAICNYCDGVVPAMFTKRTVSDESEILVGAEDAYVAVCRKHYLETQ